MVKVFTGVFINCEETVGIATIVLDDNNKITGHDHVGGDIKGEAHPDGDDLVIHASVTVAKGVVNVMNEDYGQMDGETETPLVVVIPDNLKIDELHDTPLEAGGTATTIRIRRIY